MTAPSPQAASGVADGERSANAWVIGGGSGIGQATALELCRSGWRVAVSGRGAAALQAFVEQVPADRALAVPCDVADAGAVSAAQRAISDVFGPLDALIYCAGINITNRHWGDLRPEDAKTLIDINLLGAAYSISSVLPAMRVAGRGTVVVVSSWAGWTPTLFTGPIYSASKTALGSLVESINAEEGRHGLRACLICPAEVATPILRSRSIPPSENDLSRMLQADDVAAAVSFAVCAPPHVCINELVISPVWNRIYTEPHRLSSLATGAPSPSEGEGK